MADDNVDPSPQREDFVQDLGSFHQKVLSIRTQLDENKAVDLTSDPSKYINIWDYHGGENQQWQFLYDSTERSYQIVSVDTRKAMKGNADGSMTMVNPTGPYESYDYGAYWQLLKINNTSYYLIKNMASGLLLDLDNANTANGTRIKTFRENGEAAQYWNLQAVGETIGEFNGKVLSIHTELNWDKAIDVNMSNKSIAIWDYNAGDNQKWTFRYDSTKKAYQIVSLATGNCLYPDYRGNLGLTVPSFEFGDSYWYVIKDDPYSCYYIKNWQHGTFIDLAGSDTTNGQPVIAYEEKGEPNQLWHLFENRPQHK